MRYELVKSRKTGWELKCGGEVVRNFHTKTLALDALRRLLRREGGSVRIFAKDGSFQDERTFFPFARERRVPLSRSDRE